MITFCANAKLNLYLDITGRRGDGYHTLETIMQSIDLCDTVSVRLTGSGGITVRCSDPLIPSDERNICHKAAKKFFAALGREHTAEIVIEKRIPHGAGLGGGSADAAAVLTGLNRLLDEPLSTEKLLETAESVGADVPFCMIGGTKLCGGIGGKITDTEPFPERKYLVVMPEFRCDTGAGYSAYDKTPVPARGNIEAFRRSGAGFPGLMYNVFKELYSDERIDGLLRRLVNAGAQGAALSGSGAAVFGVFADERGAISAAREFPGLFTAVCSPVGRGLIEV